MHSERAMKVQVTCRRKGGVDRYNGILISEDKRGGLVVSESNLRLANPMSHPMDLAWRLGEWVPWQSINISVRR